MDSSNKVKSAVHIRGSLENPLLSLVVLQLVQTSHHYPWIRPLSARVIRVTLWAPWHCYNNGHRGDILSESVMKHVSYVYLEYAQYIIPPVDRPEPCQGGLVWGCETSGPGLSWQRENDAWSGLSGPGGSLGKNFPGKVSHPLSRPRSHNTNMLCDESHGSDRVCTLRRTQQWQLTSVCVFPGFWILRPIFDGKRKVSPWKWWHKTKH